MSGPVGSAQVVLASQCQCLEKERHWEQKEELDFLNTRWILLQSWSLSGHVCPAVPAASIFPALERQPSIWQGCWPCKPALWWLILWFVFQSGWQLKRWQMAHSADLCVCCPVSWSVWFQQKVQVFCFSFPYQPEGEGHSSYLPLFSRQMPWLVVMKQEIRV